MIRSIYIQRKWVYVLSVLSAVFIICGLLWHDLVFGLTSWQLYGQFAPLKKQLNKSSRDPFSPTAESLNLPPTASINNKLTILTSYCPQTLLIKRLPQNICPKIADVANLGRTLYPLLHDQLSSPHTYIIVFQNAEELRASGGFMGSFARVTVGPNGIESLTIEDIYEPDGQFKGYVPAPTGVEKYLSSGNGLRLPDANWDADFPTAAQTILTYFSFGDQNQVDGVVTLNSDVIKQLLTVTGDIYLPDYDTNVSAETFTTLARADRDQFFPGSKQKQHFLSAFFTQLKLRLAELSPTQQRQLLDLLITNLANKNIMIYHTNPETQAQLAAYDLTGDLNSHPNCFSQHLSAIIGNTCPLPQTSTISPTPTSAELIYLLESNVGINKANKNITREVQVNLEDHGATMRVTFTNNNEILPSASSSANLDYINYQRVLVPEGWELLKATVGQQPVTTWDEEVIIGSTREKFTQIGVLVPVPAQQQQTLELRFRSSQPSISNQRTVTFARQPGLPPTPYTVTWRDQTHTFVLEQDWQLHLTL